MPDNNSLTHGLRMSSEHASIERKAGVFIRLNKTVGPYGAVLFFFALAVCGSMGVTAVWVRQDIVKPIVDGHRAYLEDQTKRAAVIEETQVAIKDSLGVMVQQSKELNEKTDQTHEMQLMTQELLKQQTEWHRRSTDEQRKTNTFLQTGRIKVSNGPETANGGDPMPMGTQPN